MLERIQYLTPTSSIEKGGAIWVAHSVKEWASRLKVGERTVKRAFATLRRAGLIETSVHWMGRHKKQRRLFVRPIDENVKGQNGPYLTNLKCQNGPLESEQGAKMALCSLYLCEKTKTCEKTGDLFLDSSFEAEEEGEEKMGTLKENIPRALAGAHMFTAKQKVTAFGLDFKKLWGAHYGTYCPTWTIKERGSADLFLRRCQEGAIEPLQALQIVFSDWGGLRHFAKAEEGAFPLPDKPDIGWPVLRGRDLDHH